MKGMKWTVIMALPLIFAGCYDLEDGSIAAIFDGLHNENEGDPDSGVEGTDLGEMSVDWTQCDLSNLDVFNEMKTGDTCNFDSACGSASDSEARFVKCINGILSVSETVELDDDSPRADALWTDCASAMADARAGERCSGYFTCTIPVDNSCIEQWACDGETEWTQITHTLTCNGSKSYAVSDSEPIEDCAAVANARPLDPCTGSFLCTSALSDSPTAIPACSDAAGFCLDESVWPFADWAYCDGIALHFFSDISLQ